MDKLFPPKPKWLPKDMPNLEGKVALVTGGNAGIGLHTVRHLMFHGASVYMFSRTPSKGEAACRKLEAEVKAEGGTGNVKFIRCDLSDLNSVKASAEEFTGLSSRLDYLLASGGTMASSKDEKTVQGFDLQMGTNAIGHHYLIKLLLPTLQETAKASPEKNAVRVCVTASELHTRSSGFDPKDPEMQNIFLKRFWRLWNFKMYGHSKMANILDANAWARKYGKDGIVFNSCHPGSLKTDLASGFFWDYILGPIFLYPSEMGSYTQLYAATSEDASKFSGTYLTAWARVGKAKSVASNPKVQDDWFNWAEEQIAARMKN